MGEGEPASMHFGGDWKGLRRARGLKSGVRARGDGH